MLQLLATILIFMPLSFGHECLYYGYEYSTGDGSLFHSPNYPESFPFGINCDWEVEIPNAESITVECEYFSLRGSQNCDVDYLEISEDGETYENAAVYCGYGYLRHTVNTNVFKAHFGSQYRQFYDNSYGFECQLSYTEAQEVSESDPDSDTSGETCKCGVKNTGNSGGRIVGGGEASMNEYPWQCMLRDADGYHFCGCSLINNKYILTASHCVVDGDTGEVTNPRDIFVSLGDHQKYTADETDKTIHVMVASIIPHENYNSEITDNDIAILELAQPVQYNDAISPVCLPFNKQNIDVSGLMGTVTGWGTTSSGGEDSEMLLEVIIPLLNTEECRSYLGTSITENNICTYEEGKDSCQGDSGGPLVCDMSNNGIYYQVGVVSWGVGCAAKDYPGVYAMVQNYLDWIISKTDGNFCKK